MATRRLFLGRAAGLALALGPAALAAGCSGWTPLYADREAGPADAALRAIHVDPIPERIGQHLEIGLRQALNPDGIATAQRYRLRVSLRQVRADLGVLVQGLGTRSRLDVYADYALSDLRTNAPLFAGTSRASESFDILANNYANVVAENDAKMRAADQLRDDIVGELTVFLQRRAAAAHGKT